MVASNQRPIPLRKRADLVVAKIDYLGVGYQVIEGSCCAQVSSIAD